jgi:hypothetical protein
MHKIAFISLVSLFFFTKINAQKFDTTVKAGRISYRVVCSNKDSDANTVSVYPSGFQGNGGQNISFTLLGRVSKADIDDFNNDGYPDLIFYSYDSRHRGQVYCVSSSENKSCVPIYMKDIYTDSKLRVGYNGHDEFSIVEGMLFRKFPIYKTTDSSTTNEKIGTRIIEYKTGYEKNALMFQVLNTYDVKN